MIIKGLDANQHWSEPCHGELRKEIYRLRFVQCANARLPGAKNGKIAGRMLSIARIGVVVGRAMLRAIARRVNWLRARVQREGKEGHVYPTGATKVNYSRWGGEFAQR